jgi:putative SOS response-associated peptidase YedK
MMFAGLWDEWKNPVSGVLRSYTMLTTEPNELVGRVHNCMPVIVAREHWAKWLGEEPAAEDHLRVLLSPYPAEIMNVTPPLGMKPRQKEPKEKCQMQLL